MLDALGDLVGRRLMERVDECILNLEQRAAATAMCYISSSHDEPTWKNVAQRLHLAGEKKAAMAAKAYLTKGKCWHAIV